jgi:hypothetical protein
VPQAPFDHFASQPVGVLPNAWTRRELMLLAPIGLDLLSNVFVEMSEPFVGHMFDTHDQLLLVLNTAWHTQTTTSLDAAFRRPKSRVSRPGLAGRERRPLKNGI